MRFGILAGYTIKNVGEMSIGLGMDNAENAAGTKFSDLTVGVNLRGYKQCSRRLISATQLPSITSRKLKNQTVLTRSKLDKHRVGRWSGL